METNDNPTSRDEIFQPDSLPILDAALFWAEAGVAVFPCTNNKKPMTPKGFYDATNDPEAVRALFGKYPDAKMIGAAMGDASGMFAIDLDLYKGPEAQAWLDNLLEQNLIPDTRMHQTRRKGLHLFFNGKTMPGSSYPNDGVEIRGNGAYVIVPGGGAGYTVLREGVVPAPAALLKYVAQIKKEQASESQDTLISRILAGENFHDSISRLAARYAAMGWDQGKVTASLIDILGKSMASNPHHPRHDRWLFLMQNTSGEFMRVVTTAHKKYNTNAARTEFEAAMDEDAETFREWEEISSTLFKKPSPTSGETEEEHVRTASEYDGEWPWPGENEGYFAHHEHDLLSQRFVLYPLLAEDESVLIAAEPKTGKTAVALTLGLHIAVGRDVGPSLRVAEPRGVLYFGLEGRRAIRMRVEAWKRHFRGLGNVLPDFIPFFVVERSTNLLPEANRVALAEKILAAEIWMKEQKQVDLGTIFIDTLTKAMPGGDQNSVEDTSSVFDVVSRIREAGCTASVVFIHHKSRAGNIRGSTNIEADPDVLMSVSKEGEMVRLHLDRARSIEEGLSYQFKLTGYDLGVSTQGYQIQGVVAEISDEKVTGSDDMAMAMAESKALGLILGLGKGSHALSVIHDILHEAGLAPCRAALRGASRKISNKLRWDAPAAQTWYDALVPDLGRVFGGTAIEKVTQSGKIIAILVY